MNDKFQDDGVPCKHPGCFNHVTHPCEGCGRIGGKYPMGFSIGSKIKAFFKNHNGEEVEIGQIESFEIQVNPAAKTLPVVNKPIRAEGTIAFDSRKVERRLLRLMYRGTKRRHINIEKAKRRGEKNNGKH